MAEKNADFGVRGPNPEALLRAQRLREAIFHARKSKEEVADEVGISPSTLKNYLKGSDMQIGTAQALARATGVSDAWLILGAGDNPKDKKLPSNQGKELPDYVALPRYDARAAAGDGEEVFSEAVTGHMAFSQDWIENTLRRKSKNLALIDAVGVSMAPTIHDGDTLMVDVSVKEITSDGIYVIRASSGLLVKRVQIDALGGYVVISDNPAFRSQTIGPRESAEMRVIGEVVWHGGFGR